MATDEERLVVTLEARVRDFEKNFERAQKTSDRRLRGIENRARTSASTLQTTFSTMGKGVSASLSGAFSMLGGAGLLGGTSLAGILSTVKGATADLANTAAEAKRAGVGVEVFQELGYAAGQSRVGIDALTDGLKELQLRADEYIVTGSGSASEAFKRLGLTADDLKVKLADPAALFEEIIDKLSRLDTASRIRIADEIFGGTGGEQFVRLLDEGSGYIARMRKEARETGNVLDKELIDQAIEIDREFTKIGSTIGNNVKSAIVGVVQKMREFSQGVTNLGNASLFQRFNEYMGYNNAETAAAAGVTYTPPDTYGDFESRRGQALTDLPEPDTRPAGMGLPVESAAKIVKGYQDIATAARERIATLEVERATIGMTTQAAVAYRFEQDLLNEAAREKIALSPAEQASVKQLAEHYSQLTVETQAATLAQGKMIDAMDEVRYTGADVLGSFVSDLRAGVDGADALANALDRVISKLADNAINSFIGALFGQPGTPGGGAIGGFISSLFSGGLPGRATGGPVSSGQAYMVGERGPEIMVPGRSGFVIPNHALGGSPGGQAPRLTVNVQTLQGTTADVGRPRKLADGGFELAVVMRQIKQELVADLETRGDFARAAEGRWGLDPTRGMY